MGRMKRNRIVIQTLLCVAIPVAFLLGHACSNPQVEQATHYLMRGLHRDVPCSECHQDSPLNETPTVCAACHQDDRPAAHNDGPCENCHTEFGWGDAAVDHSFFPLHGGHEGLDCFECHEPGDYTTLDRACGSCHENDRPTGHYEPIDCFLCHPLSDWADGLFDHAFYFPIPHRDAVECDDCHLDPNNLDEYSCIHCHEHSEFLMDKHHREVPPYVYSSTACVTCHPDGLNGGQ